MRGSGRWSLPTERRRHGARRAPKLGRSRQPVPEREALLAAERRDDPPPTFRRGERLFIVAFANAYRVAMSNLGFQVVRRTVEGLDGWRAERAFDEEPTGTEGPRTFESRLPLREAAALGFSLSTELDGPRLARMLFRSAIPILAARRGERDPIVLLGGAAPTVNPEPWALLADVILLGEAEGLLEPILAALGGTGSREARLEACAGIEGVYVPSRHRAVEEAGRLVPDPPPPKPACAGALDDYRTATGILTPHTEFADVRLIEISRGCSRGCRFCVVPGTWGRARFRSAESVRRLAGGGSERVGLVGAAAADHPDLLAILRGLREDGHPITLSASRVDQLAGEVLAELVAGGQRVMTIAPETTDPEVQERIRKRLPAERIHEVAETCARLGFSRLKLYFIVGLPGAREDEAEEIARFTEGLLPHCDPLHVVVSAGVFVPKPRTPFERSAFPAPADAKASLAHLVRRLSRMGPRVEPRLGSVRHAQLEALLSRGDRRVGLALESLAPLSDPGLAEVSAALASAGLEPERLLAAIPEGDALPWIGVGDV